MRDRFDKFTERARKVLSLAQEEAQRFQHDYIGTEHLLLGLVREGEGVAAKVLASFRIDLARLRSAVEYEVGRGERVVVGEIRLTDDAKRSIEMAVDEAQSLNHHYIGTEHLLLGLTHFPKSTADRILASMGVLLENLRTQTIEVLGSSPAPTPRNSTSRAGGIRGRDRFDKFTERARKVLSYAQEEAQRFQHHYIGTEHLLLGLAREEGGVAAKALANLGAGLETVRARVEFIIGRGDRIILGEIGLTPRSKRVVELAVDEARRLNHHYIGTEHLLLGLVREGEGIASGVLESMGIGLEQVRAEILRILKQQGAGATEGNGERATTAPHQPSLSAEFDRYLFTDDTQKAMSFAQEEAALLQHNYLGPEHLLLGLLREEKGIAAKVLQSLNINLAEARNAVESVAGRGSSSEPGDRNLTPLARAYIHLAADEASKLGQGYLGVEHLLLGLLREEKGIIPTLLERLGTEVATVRTKTIEVIQALN